MRNIQHLCPSFSTILINTYRVDVALYIEGTTLFSEEGTTQGDPLAMQMYALGVLPLIDCISGDLMQVWYADDATTYLRLTFGGTSYFSLDLILVIFRILQRHVWL